MYSVQSIRSTYLFHLPAVAHFSGALSDSLIAPLRTGGAKVQSFEGLLSAESVKRQDNCI